MQRLLGLALLLAIAAAIAFTVDMPVARWFRAGGIAGDLGKVIHLAEVFAHGSGVLLIALAAASLDPRSWRVLPRIAVAAFGAGLLADLIKITLGRTRPEKLNWESASLTVWDTFLGPLAWRDAESWREGLSRDIQSFPSGHAATAAGLACALSRFYPRGAWFFAAMALLASFQRIEASAHYLSDVLAGAAIGTLAATALELPRVRKLFARLESP